jgi:hypothetical protein
MQQRICTIFTCNLINKCDKKTNSDECLKARADMCDWTAGFVLENYRIHETVNGEKNGLPRF